MALRHLKHVKHLASVTTASGCDHRVIGVIAENTGNWLSNVRALRDKEIDFVDVVL